MKIKVTSSNTISKSESIDAGKPVAVFFITAHIGFVKLRIV